MAGISAVVLVGGFGTRLRPVTYRVPKQLIPVAGEPVLLHVLDLLPPEVNEVVMACGYKAEVFEAYLKAHPYRLPVRVVREDRPLGSAGALLNASEGLSDPFILVNGDVVTSVDMAEMLRFHREHGGLGTISLFQVDDPSPYGVAVMEEGDRIVRFVEKPTRAEAPSRWINAGTHIWSRALLDEIPPGRLVGLEKELIPGLLPRGVYGFTFQGWFEDAGTPARMLNAQHLLFDHPRQDRFRPRAHLPGGQLLPPVATGKACEGEGAKLGRYATLGDRVRLGAGAEVEDSILLDDVVVGVGATVRRCILGPGYRVPAGARLEDLCLSNDAPPA